MTEVNELFGFGKKKQPTDEFKSMHDTLTSHGYVSKDYKTYKHKSGMRAHLRPHHLYRDDDQKTKLGGPTTVHSSGRRYYSGKDLDHDLSKLHEDAPTNCMGGSSSTSGPIATFDPFLKNKALKRLKKGKSDAGGK